MREGRRLRTYSESDRDVRRTRFGQNTHELLERLERLAKIEAELHLVDASEICKRKRKRDEKERISISMIDEADSKKEEERERERRKKRTRNPGSIVVVVEPAPTSHSSVVVVHDPLQALDVSVHEIVHLVGSFGILELELLLNGSRTTQQFKRISASQSRSRIEEKRRNKQTL